MRGWLNPTRSYVPPVAIGAPMRALAVGRVVLVPKTERTVEGGNDKSAPLMDPLKVGDWVTGVAGWAEYAKLPVKDLQKIQCVCAFTFLRTDFPVLTSSRIGSTRTSRLHTTSVHSV